MHCYLHRHPIKGRESLAALRTAAVTKMYNSSYKKLEGWDVECTLRWDIKEHSIAAPVREKITWMYTAAGCNLRQPW